MSLQKLLDPIRNKIKMVLGRAIINLVKDSTPIQLVQVSIMKDELKDDVERLNDYGFTSVPRPGSEALICFINGNRDQGIALKVDDSRVRIKNLKSGEVAVYNFKGTYIKLDDVGNIEISSEGDVVIKKAGVIKLGGDILLPTAGVVTGEAICPFTGVPHADFSSVVLAKK